MKLHPRARLRLGAVALAATLAVVMSGCSSQGGGSTTIGTKTVTQAEIDKAMKQKITLNEWTWLPDATLETKLFEKQYPNITVKVSNVGTGLPFYTKLRTALKAGTGPDLAQMEYANIPAYPGAYLDLTPYGAASLKKDFSAGTWSNVAVGNQIIGIPQDFGPMGAVYRTDLFKAAGLSSYPKTWDEFATDAAIIKQKTGNYITDATSSNATWWLALMQQAGLNPFSYDGKKTVKIDLTNAKALQFIDFWNTLVKKDLVGTGPDFVTDWYQNVNAGKYQSWLVAAWGPVFMTGPLAATSGKWTAAPLPQYDTANPVGAYWGGAATVGFKDTKYPIQTYMLLKFLNASQESTTLMATKQSLFMAYQPTLNSSTINDQKSDFFGGQQVNKVYNNIAQTVKPGFQFLPFQDEVASSFNSTLGSALSNRTDLAAGLKAWQAALVTFAQQQGYTVSQ